MDLAYKVALVAALRSGEYLKGTSLLKYSITDLVKHCSLGVAYEIQGANWEVDYQDEEEISYVPMFGTTFPERPLGMTQEESYLISRLNDGWESRQHLLETLEDHPELAEKLIQEHGECCNGLDFNQMADLIEKYF